MTTVMTFYLSPRQIEVVTLVGRDGVGWSVAARTMGISYHTAISHAEKAQQKAGVTRKKLRAAMSEIYWRHVHTA
jgi:DNA-binding CsgD family transcriptional regulator